MRKYIKSLLVLILCFALTACGAGKNEFMGTDLTPWLNGAEGTDVFTTIDTGGAFGIDGIPGPYDAVPLLLEIETVEKLDYDHARIHKLKSVNGEYMVALENKNDKPNLAMYLFYEDFQVMRVNEGGKGVFYRVTGTEKLKEYFVESNQYISPENYAELKKLINDHISDGGKITDWDTGNVIVLPAGSIISGDYRNGDFRLNIYGLKESPYYIIDTYVITTEGEKRAEIRVLTDNGGNMSIDKFMVM